jgi:hypothetical protein
MNQKIEITKYIAEQEKLSTDPNSIKKYLRLWWQNPRSKEVGGLKLTEQGFNLISKYIKSYEIRYENKFQYTNQLILRLDNYITCPWFTTERGIYVFNETMAIQMVLFSGNIQKFSSAKARSLELTKTES